MAGLVNLKVISITSFKQVSILLERYLHQGNE